MANWATNAESVRSENKNIKEEEEIWDNYDI